MTLKEIQFTIFNLKVFSICWLLFIWYLDKFKSPSLFCWCDTRDTKNAINHGQNVKTIKFHGLLFEAAVKLMEEQSELVEQDADP